MIVLQCI